MLIVCLTFSYSSNYKFDKFGFSGLFHKSIIQSGVATNPWAFTVHSPKEAAIKISSILGKKTTDTKELIKYLRTVDVIELAKAEHKIKSMKVFIIFRIYLISMIMIYLFLIFYIKS